MRNLTPHPISILLDNEETVTLPPSGQVARVLMDEQDGGTVMVAGHEIQAVSEWPGDVIGIPEDVSESRPVIVSAKVAAVLAGMPGVYAPDTGATAVRDEHGNITAVRRLIKA